MAKDMKLLMAEEVRQALAGSDDLLVISLLQMNAQENLELRRRLRSQGASLRVIHNRTSRFALDEVRQPVAELFAGQTAIALAEPETEFAPIAKALVEAARKMTIEVRGGYVDGELLDKEGVVALAKAPDKPTLRAMLLGAINGPARGLAIMLQGVGGGVARCLQARIDQGEKSDS